MADNNKTIISKVPAEAFLVRDKSLRDFDAPFYNWLRNNGFKHAWHKGHFGCDWVFVNITHKLFAYGMPGVGIVKPIGNHAITLDEFYQIYEIYAKYEGLELMAFSKEEQKEHHTIRCYIRTTDADTRRSLIEMLEKDGYKIEDSITTKQAVIESECPVMVNKTDKVFGILHDSEDAAKSSGRLMDVEEFCVLYKGAECSYDEYYAAVAKLFVKQSRYNEEEAKKIIEEEKEYLQKSYKVYTTGHTFQSPDIVAHNLFLMY